MNTIIRQNTYTQGYEYNIEFMSEGKDKMTLGYNIVVHKDEDKEFRYQMIRDMFTSLADSYIDKLEKMGND